MSTSKCLGCASKIGGSLKRPFIQFQSLRPPRQYATDAPDTSLATASSTSSGTQKERKRPETVTDAPSKRSPKPVAESNPSLPSTSEDASNTAVGMSTSGEGEEGVKISKPIPPNVFAAYRTPLRLKKPDSQKRVLVADIQLRSYSVRNLEFFGDFAMRVAQYLKIPTHGPTPLPKIIERWTMPKSNFVHKKTQENFERITRRRVIKLYNGHKDTVEVFLACLRKWQFYGVGMKANVYDWEGLDVVKKMDEQAAEVEGVLDEKLSLFGWNNHSAPYKSIQDLLLKQGVKHAGSPMTEVRDAIKNAKNVYLK